MIISLEEYNRVVDGFRQQHELFRRQQREIAEKIDAQHKLIDELNKRLVEKDMKIYELVKQVDEASSKRFESDSVIESLKKSSFEHSLIHGEDTKEIISLQKKVAFLKKKLARTK